MSPYRDGARISSPMLIVIVAALVLVTTLVMGAAAVLYAGTVADDAGREGARKALEAVRSEAKANADRARGDILRGCRRGNGDRKANAHAWRIAARTRFKTANTPGVPTTEREAAAAAGAAYMHTVGVLRSHIVECRSVYAPAR